MNMNEEVSNKLPSQIKETNNLIENLKQSKVEKEEYLTVKQDFEEVKRNFIKLQGDHTKLSNDHTALQKTFDQLSTEHKNLQD